MADEERKIIIDEDWKAQVQREKEEAARKAEQQAQPDAKAPSAEEDAEAPEGSEPRAGTPFMALVQSLATQAMFALGLIAPQEGGQVMVDIQQAHLLIDMLADLREKTKGNLDATEKGMLDEAVAELQRIYVVRAQQAHEATMRQAGVDPRNLKGDKPS